jgi:CubicO group peptidase (beta-lactamase class C family)
MAIHKPFQETASSFPGSLVWRQASPGWSWPRACWCCRLLKPWIRRVAERRSRNALRVRSGPRVPRCAGRGAGPSERLVARSGVAGLKTRRPVLRNARYRIGSTTKTFVSLVVLPLVGEGELRPNDMAER